VATRVWLVTGKYVGFFILFHEPVC